jgi:hypothetical protein
LSDIVIRRGDTFGPSQLTFSLVSGGILGAVISFKIKKAARDTTALLFTRTSDGAPMIVIDDSTHATLEIPKERTALLPVGNLWFDVEVLLPNGRNYTTDSGTCQVLPD